MKKFLVTGGAGFIGSHLVERLVKDGHEVVVMDTELRGNKIPSEIMDKIDFRKEDIRDLDAVMKACEGVDVIFHLAAVLGVDVVADNPVETMEVEAIGMMNLAQAIEAHKIPKIMYASTSGVYGMAKISEKVTEKDPVDPKTSYAIAKRYNEIYLAGLHQERGLKSVSLRFFNVYGPRQDERMVVPRFIAQAKAGEDITVFDDGMQTRDFTFIDDTIEACIQLMNKVDGCEIFNVANEEEMNILRLAEIIKAHTGSDSKIVNIPSPHARRDFEVKRRFGSSEKLFEQTGYRPNTTLAEGLKAIF